MTAAEALQQIRGLASANRYIISGHARQQARARGVSQPDIHYGLINAVACGWQADRKTWKVDSTDLDGQALTLVVAIYDDMVVVTVF